MIGRLKILMILPLIMIIILLPHVNAQEARVEFQIKPRLFEVTPEQEELGIATLDQLLGLEIVCINNENVYLNVTVENIHVSVVGPISKEYRRSDASFSVYPNQTNLMRLYGVEPITEDNGQILNLGIWNITVTAGFIATSDRQIIKAGEIGGNLNIEVVTKQELERRMEEYLHSRFLDALVIVFSISLALVGCWTNYTKKKSKVWGVVFLIALLFFIVVAIPRIKDIIDYVLLSISGL